MTDKQPAMEEETDDDHPGPGYELVCDHDASWKVYYNKAEGCYAFSMPEEDSAQIEAQARAEGVSVEVYLRRKFGLPDEPPPDRPSDKTCLPTNDNREQLYREMPHVKFFAKAWNVSASEIIEEAAKAIDNDYSFEDIQYQIAVTVQQCEKLLRRVMAGKTPQPSEIVRAIERYGWLLLLLGEMARRLGTIDAMKDIAAQAEKFQITVDAFKGKARSNS